MRKTPAFDEDVDSQKLDKTLSVVLYNDNIHSFDFVVHYLMQICKHENIQAHQCASITHHNGKCSVKVGNYLQLEKICYALHDVGLDAKIE